MKWDSFGHRHCEPVDYIGLIELKANNVKLELFNLNDDISTAESLWSYEEKTFYRTSYNYSEYITKDGTL